MVGVNVSVGGRGVKVNVVSRVGLGGGRKTVAVSVAAIMTVIGISVSGIVTGCAGARPGPQAKTMSIVNKRIEKGRFFIFIVNIVNVSVWEIIVASKDKNLF